MIILSGKGLTKSFGEKEIFSDIDFQVKEGEKLGYDVIFLSKYNKIKSADYNIEIKTLSKVNDLLKLLF